MHLRPPSAGFRLSMNRLNRLSDSVMDLHFIVIGMQIEIWARQTLHRARQICRSMEMEPRIQLILFCADSLAEVQCQRLSCPASIIGLVKKSASNQPRAPVSERMNEICCGCGPPIA